MAKLPKIRTESEKEEVEDQNAAVAAVVASAQTKADESAKEEPAVESEDMEEPAVDAEVTTDTKDDDDAADSGENPETAPPAPETPPVVIVTAPKQMAAPKETNVRVALICDHSCTIGGVAYHFTKGKMTYVPEPVKEILRRAGLLAAL